MNFCRRCGSILTKANESAYTCANGHPLYANPAPTVGLFLIDGADIILPVRGREPFKGTLDAFGGFVEADESLEEAMIREMQEETGLSPSDYSPLIYIGSAPSRYSYGGEERTVVSAIYVATIKDGVQPSPSDDVAALRRLPIADVSIDDIGNDDIKAGFLLLKKHLSL